MSDLILPRPDGSNGRPVTTGSVTNTDGNVLASLHAARLDRLAGKLSGREKAHVLAAAKAMRLLAKKNRRLGSMVGGVMKRGLLTYRGVALTGRAEDIAETIADLASKQQVTAYRWRDMRKVRVVAGDGVPKHGRLIGTYNAASDYRQILADILEPEPGPTPRALKSDPPELRAVMQEFRCSRQEARIALKNLGGVCTP